MENAQDKALAKLETGLDLTPVVVGFGSLAGFELMLRQAKWISESSLVPKQFQKNPSNCLIALEMAGRMEASPFAVMQNMYVVYGKPGWSSTFIIASINSTGKFSPLRFDLTPPGSPETIEATFYEDQKMHTVKETIRDVVCVAWATEKATGERLESPPVSLRMAVLEGWYSKKGSKWKTMPELMLRYRCATLFGRLYCPEVTSGMRTVEEVVDIGPDDFSSTVVSRQDGKRKRKAAHEPEAAAEADDGGQAEGEATTVPIEDSFFARVFPEGATDELKQPMRRYLAEMGDIMKLSVDEVMGRALEANNRGDESDQKTAWAEFVESFAGWFNKQKRTETQAASKPQEAPRTSKGGGRQATIGAQRKAQTGGPCPVGGPHEGAQADSVLCADCRSRPNCPAWDEAGPIE